MKIAIVISEFNMMGGAQRQAAELACYLKKKGDNVIIYTDYYSKDCYPQIVDGIRIKFLHEEKKQEKVFENKILLFLWKAINYINKNFQNARELVKIIDKDTDILNCHDLNVEIASFLFCKKNEIPLVWHVNDIHRCFGAREESKFKRIFFYIFDFPERLIQKRIARYAEVITVNVSKNKDLVKKYLKREALVFHCGADIKRFKFKQYKEFSETIELFAIGIMFPYRKHEVLIKAVKILKDENINIHLTILGSSLHNPLYAKELKDLVEKLDIVKEVVFLETVKDEDLMNLYQKTDIFAFINHQQSWGIVVFEAMASGVPVIVSQTVGATEILKDKETALIIPPNSVEAVVLAIKELLNNKGLCKKLIENGKKLIQNMSWEKMYCEKMRNLFNTIYARK